MKSYTELAEQFRGGASSQPGTTCGSRWTDSGVATDGTFIVCILRVAVHFDIESLSDRLVFDGLR